MAPGRTRAAQSADHGHALIKPFVIGQIEMEDERFVYGGSADEVDPDEFTTIDQEMLDLCRAQPARDRPKHGPAYLAPIGSRRGARREHTRIDGRRPHRPGEGAAVRRILSESAAPSATRTRHRPADQM